MRRLEKPASSQSPLGATLLGGMVTVACLLPLFITGALAVQLMDELRFGASALGIAISLTRASGAATSLPLGRLADALGARRAIRVAAVAAAIASLGIATTTDRWLILVFWLMVSGCAGALGQPAANRLLARNVGPNRLGLAFGLKQSAPPVSSMVAGLSVPLLALTLGWRWVFGAAGLVALVVAVVARPSAPIGSRTGFLRSRRDAVGRLPASPWLIALLAAAFGLGTASSSMLTAFYVETAVRVGSTPALAGTVLAIASATAIAVRIAAGALSDRLATTHLALCAALISVGAVGLGVMSVGVPPAMAVGAVAAAAGVWGINGVFWFALVRAFPAAPGRITGAVAPGALLGGTAGPLVFGLVVEEYGAPVAWRVATATAVAAAAAMLVAHFSLRNHLARGVPPPSP